MSVLGLACTRCNAQYPLEPMFFGCPACLDEAAGGAAALTVAYDYQAVASDLDIEDWGRAGHGIWRFDALLPIRDPAAQISLGEGNTALVRPRAVCEATGLPNLYIKNETTNPTWAFKDRFHASSVSMARTLGYSRVTASTTGNHGASAAAYCAAAGLDSCVILCHPESSKLQRDMIALYGGHAFVLADRFQYLDTLIRDHGFYPSTTMTPMPTGTPFGIEGYKTIAFEIFVQLGGRIPDRMFCPIAAGDALYGPWKGFNELLALKIVDRNPVMHGVQPAGCNPYVQSFRQGRGDVIVHPDPRSIALSIRDDTGGPSALGAIYDSGGDATDVTEDEIVEAVRLLARSGYLVEPSSAASVAGAVKAARAGRLDSDETVVCLVTGSGAKWPEVMAELADRDAPVEPSWEEIRTRAGLDSTTGPAGTSGPGGTTGPAGTSGPAGTTDPAGTRTSGSLHSRHPDERPVIGITLGDPNGVGPEIIARILSQEWVYGLCRPLVIGHDEVVRQALSLVSPAGGDSPGGRDGGETAPNLDIRVAGRPADGLYRHGTVDVLNAADVEIAGLEPGRVQAEAGRLAVESVKRAAGLAMAGDIAAVVTAPMNKAAMGIAGYPYAGHTELLAEITGTKRYRLALAFDGTLVSHATTHVSLRDAIERLSEEEILDTVDLVGRALVGMGVAAPRIAVCGLNPHAGEGGLFGDEEIRIIAPAVEEARAKSGAGTWRIAGPLPPDTVFMRARKGEFDGIVGMYHDQGHIPVKAIAFDRAVNVTLGLPIIRTSVDHGTAFDIAGRGMADAANLGEALRMAVRLVGDRWSVGSNQ